MFLTSIAGLVKPTQNFGEYEVVVEEVGVCAVDSYDFNGWQYLGHWAPPDDVSFAGVRGETLHNEDFRAWRQKYKRGGDFEILTPLKRTVLPSPDIFLI